MDRRLFTFIILCGLATVPAVWAQASPPTAAPPTNVVVLGVTRFDPFGNLTLRQRARLGAARELAKGGGESAAAEKREGLVGEFSALKTAPLGGYWGEFLLNAR